MNKCVICGLEISGKAKTCSPAHRKLLSRQGSVTSVTGEISVTSPDEASVTFDFYTISKANGMGRLKDEKSPVRKAKYWYDVPIAAVPVIKKGWPEMPEYMNGRQYFLWWQNEFKEKDGPVIHNPFKVRNNTA